jgi:hypothetical protein
MIETLLDPNGQNHQVGDLYCSGCDYHPQDPSCGNCGCLNHYWYIDDAAGKSLVGFECESCGGFKELSPVTSDESA